MKSNAKNLFLVTGLISFNAQAALPFAFAAVRGAFQASRFALKHGMPAIKEVAATARPAFQHAHHFVKTNPFIKEKAAKVALFVRQNPRETGFIGLGAAAGYYFSDKGVLNTVGGTVLGAFGGAYWAGLRAANTARLAFQAELATAGQRIEMLTYEGNSLRAQLDATQKGYAIALEKLKNAAKPVVEKVGLGVKKELPASPSTMESLKKLWELRKAGKPGVGNPALVEPALFGMA
jgi:hypothetical protein